MTQIETEIMINATPEKVWEILADFESYPNWNPFIIAIDGNKSVGKKLNVSIKPPDGKMMSFKPIVLKFKRNHEFRWIGKLGFKGVFDGEHYFILEKVDDCRTKLIHGEIFSGLLTFLLSKTLEKTHIGFQLMNEAIKKECESGL